MKNENNIEEWYRNEISDYKINPIENGWDAINDKLNKAEQQIPLEENNIESWYQKEISKFNVQPNQQVWNKLSTNLDVQNVWSRVLITLNKFDRLIWWRNLSLRLFALIILFFGGYITFSNLNDSDLNRKNLEFIDQNYPLTLHSTLSTKKTNLKSHTLVGSSVVAKGNEDVNKTNNYVGNSKSNSSNVNSNNTHVSTASKINKSNSTKLNVVNASLNIEKVLNKTLFNLEEELHTNELHLTEKQEADLEIGTLELKEFLIKKNHNKIIFNNKRFSSHFVFGLYAKRFYVGLNTGVKNQNIFTKINSKSSLHENNLLDFGFNYGGTFGYIMSDNLNFETIFNFVSTAGYNRTYLTEELKYGEHLNLNYTTISVLAKRMNNKSTFDNKKYSTNLIGGIFGGRLTSANLNSKNAKIDVAENFKSIDLGFVIGIEQDRYISKQIVITPGIKYQQGLLNITNSQNFDSGRTFAIEFNLGLKYIFLKKD